MTVAEWSPRVDISEDDKVNARLPGLNKEDVRVAVQHGRLLQSIFASMRRNAQTARLSATATLLALTNTEDWKTAHPV
jgi:HSP20 family molecular chaperone IbpA